MAIIDCPECKSKVSDAAAVCPGCGYPIKQVKINDDQIKSLQKAGVGLIIISILFAFLAKNWGWLIVCPFGVLFLVLSTVLGGGKSYD